jgi:hypothetical protein
MYASEADVTTRFRRLQHNFATKKHFYDNHTYYLGIRAVQDAMGAGADEASPALSS